MPGEKERVMDTVINNRDEAIKQWTFMREFERRANAIKKELQAFVEFDGPLPLPTTVAPR